MIEFVDFFSEQRLCEMAGNPVTGVISITEPHRTAPFPDKAWGSVLRVGFHDIDRPRGSYTLFSEDQAQQVITWLDSVKERLHAVYVHCAMGVSRSAAVAMFVAQACGLDDKFNYHKAMCFNQHVYTTLWNVWTRDEKVQEFILQRRLAPKQRTSPIHSS